jgi:PAS domain S-box-containing protein
MDDLRILHIEDEVMLNNLVKGLLAHQAPFSCQIFWAESLAKGLEIIAGRPLDLILLDLYLADSQGLATLAAVRSAAPHVPIVVITGQQDSELTAQMLGQGAQEYLEKSELTSKVLFRVIRYAIERKRNEEHLILQQVEMAEQVVQATAELLDANQLLKREIAERLHVEQALRQSEAHYRVLTESITDVIWTCGLDFKFKYISPPVTRLLGYLPEELLGQRCHDILVPASETVATQALQREMEKVKNSCDGGAPSSFGMELELKRQDGATVWAEARATFLCGADDRPREMLVVVRDITEARRIHTELQRNYDIQRVLNSLLSITLDDDPENEFLTKALNLLLEVPWLTLESKGAIFLVEDDPEMLVMKAYGGLAEPIVKACSRIPFGSCLCGRAAATCQTVFADRVDDRHETTYQAMAPHGHYCVPMLVGGEVIGIINLYLHHGHKPQEAEKEFLASYANALAVAIARRKAEKALRAGEARMRTFFELLPDPVVVYDLEGRVLSLNSGFEKTFGWSRVELLGKRMDFVPAEALPGTMANLEKIKNGDSVRGFETKRLTQDGGMLDVLLNTAPLFEEGRQTGNIVVLRDITQTKAAEKALRESEARYRNLVEAIPEGIVTVAADRTVTYVNQPYASMMGYAIDEMIGKQLESLFDPEGLEILRRQWVLRQQGGKEPYEATMTRKDGARLFVMIYPRPLFSEQGHFQGTTALVTDVTQRKILESQLLQAQKLEAIGQLAAGIAHEINTPTQYVTDNTRFLRDSLQDLLTLIDSYNQLADLAREQGLFRQALAELDDLRQQLDLEYLTREIPTAVEQTMEGLDRISNIVRSMKEFAHPGPVTKTTVNLNRAIENTVMVARNEWKYVAEVEMDLDQDLPPVPCLAGEINQVILNIIVNAAHAIANVVGENADEKGTIRITTRRLDGQVELRVSDTGPGIPAEIRDRVFEPFFTTKEPGKGTGQGLAIAHRAIVDKHKGGISFETEEGRGTTFVIRLPLDLGEAEEA